VCAAHAGVGADGDAPAGRWSFVSAGDIWQKSSASCYRSRTTDGLA
jgi:hypothetical protein